MKLLTNIILIVILILLACCNNKPKKENNIKIIQEKETKKVIEVEEKAWDSLNRKNANQFFTTYGKLNKETKILLKTRLGNIKLKLYNDTPMHRASFIFLTKIGYFNNTVFYRVVKDFVIQGGNSENYNKAAIRNKYKNYKLKPEFKKNRKHKYGALAIVRSWDDNPNKLSSPFEFYIVQSKKGAHHLNNEHTVFGEVITGFETMRKIANVKVGSDQWPIEDIKMTVEIIE